MKLNIVPTKVWNPKTEQMEDHEILQFDDARIIFRNFSGKGSRYNNEGERNFAVKIDEEDIAKELQKLGWNVKIKPPRDEGDKPFMFLPVKVKFNDRGPRIYLISGKRQNIIGEEEASILDNVDIIRVGLDIRPSLWYVNGKDGKAAYLQIMEIEQHLDRFAERHMNDADSDDIPFETKKEEIDE